MPPNYPINISYVDAEKGYLVVLKERQLGIVVRTYLGLIAFVTNLDERNLKRGLDFSNMPQEHINEINNTRNKRLGLEKAL